LNRPAREPLRSRAGRIFAAAIFLWSLVLFGLRFFKHTDTDFRVFYAVGQHLADGLPLYDLARDGEACFKYLPIYGLILAPLGFFPLAVAKAIWFAVMATSLVSMVRWALTRLPWWGVAGLYALFWGVFTNGMRDGQLSIPMAALLLWMGVATTRRVALVTVLSPKIAHAFAWFALPREQLRLRVLPTVALQFIALNIAALLVVYRFQIGWAPLRAFFETITSSDHFTTFFLNQGLPAGIARMTGRYSHGFNTGLFAVLLPVVLWGATRLRGRLTPEALFFSTLAAINVIHPLAWKHSYALVFPLAVLTFERALALEAHSRKRAMILTLALVAGIGFFTSTTFGRAGSLAEHVSLRAWSTLGLIAVLTRATPLARRDRPSKRAR
jgi:hypothetical protein